MAFALTPIGTPLAVQGLPGNWLQVKKAGVAVGNANVEVIDIVGDPTLIRATRGVGENAHVVTIRKLAPGGADIGWFSPGMSSGGTAAVPNSGTYSIETTPYLAQLVLYAGVVGYVGQTIAWSLDYQTTNFLGSPPVLADLGGGKCSLTWQNVDYPFNRAYDAGLATLTATIDGTPAANVLEASMADGLYGNLVWAPRP